MKNLLFFIAMLAMISCRPKEFEPPNIILIMADDLGYGDIGCYGNETISTPALNRLAEEGMKFMDFHSNGAVCTPTRAALMTGQYQQRHGLEGVIYAKGETRQAGLDVDAVTIADFMKKAGYATGMTGKWHLGYYIDYNPVYQGFDYFRGYVSGNIDYHSHIDGAGIPDWWHDLEKVQEKGYTTDLITKYALDFIEQNKDNKFFLYIAHEAPHYPYQGRNDKTFRRIGRPKLPSIAVEEKKAAYKEMIEVMDESTDRILTLLDSLGLHEKTLIFFCSDNGGVRGIANNGSLRGHKGTLWEGGHRVPAIAWWPGMIEAGTVSDETVMSMDLFPTFVKLSKFHETPPVRFDGVELTGLLLEDGSLPDRTLFWKYRKQAVARNGDWKLLIDGDSTFLYNLSKDPDEKNNLAQDEEKIVGELKEELHAWEQEVTRGVKMKTK